MNDITLIHVKTHAACSLSAICRIHRLVWDYFSYDEKEGVKNNSRTEEQNDDSLCSKTFKSIFTTNL